MLPLAPQASAQSFRLFQQAAVNFSQFLCNQTVLYGALWSCARYGKGNMSV